jgi:hypothetical protein
MLDLGFIHDLKKIVKMLPAKRQSLFFSATMPSAIKDLADKFLTDPAQVSVAPASTTVERVDQYVTFVQQAEKQALLTMMLRSGFSDRGNMDRVLIFTRTKHGADRVVKLLAGNGIAANAIHGNKSQPQRERALAEFKAGKVKILVATDIAARGIDVSGVSHVINFELPNVSEQYVHRIGRTARAGAAGVAGRLLRRGRAAVPQGDREAHQAADRSGAAAGELPPRGRPHQIEPHRPRGSGARGAPARPGSSRKALLGTSGAARKRRGCGAEAQCAAPPGARPRLSRSPAHRWQCCPRPNKGGGMLRFSPLFLALAAAPAAAQDDEIVVTGRGLSEAIGESVFDTMILDRERLAGSASNRLDEILKEVPGFQLFRRSDARSANPTSQGATLRALGGNASSRALLILDGVPQTDPFGGWISWPAYDPRRLGQVRVVRGGGSGANGPGALAGTIDLISAAPSDLEGVAASLAYGSRDSADAFAGIGAGLGAGFLTFSGSYARGDGFAPVIPEQRGPADRTAPYEQASASVRAVTPLSGGIELQAYGLIFTDERERGTAFSDISTTGADASFRLVGSGAWQWSALGYVQTRQFYNSFASINAARTTAAQASEQYNVPSTGLGARVRAAAADRRRRRASHRRRMARDRG